MSLELPKRLRKVAFGGLGVGALLLLSGCSKADQETWKRVAMPYPRSVEGHKILHLWQDSWIVAMIVGVIVWALIFYAAFRFRRRSEDEIPVQTRYNLPIEVFYTLAPVVMVIVFFFFTVKTQDATDRPFPAKGKDAAAVSITVVGQQWSWTFDYNTKYNSNYNQGLGTSNATGLLGANQPLNKSGAPYIQADSAIGSNAQVYDVGTTANRPTLWLPVNTRVEFYLYSPDVIHSFWSTDFLFKMDVVPGRNNTFGITPNQIGMFEGRCAELCGVYHSRMLFNVNVVTPEKYNQHLADLAKQGQTGAPLGSGYDFVQPGLKNNDGSTQSTEGN